MLSKVGATAVAALAALAAVAGPALAAPGTTTLATPFGGGGLGVSDDGRYVLFLSGSPEYAANDHEGHVDAYVRDTVAGTTTLMTRGEYGYPANDDTFDGSISGDGSVVALESRAWNLVEGDEEDGSEEIFLVERETGEVTKLPGYELRQPELSRDGRYVAYYQHVNDGGGDVYVHDRHAGTTVKATPVDGAKRFYCQDLDLSAGGRHVVFSCNIQENGDRIGNGIFLRDLGDGSTTRVDRADGPGGASADSGSQWPTVSADGRFVAFTSYATNLVAEGTDPEGSAGQWDVFVRDTVEGRTQLISRPHPEWSTTGGGFRSLISDDGAYVAYTSEPLDGWNQPGTAYSLVVDRLTGAVELASRADGAEGAAMSAGVARRGLAGSGRFLLFNGEGHAHLRELLHPGAGAPAGTAPPPGGTGEQAPGTGGGGDGGGVAGAGAPAQNRPARATVRIVRVRRARRRVLVTLENGTGRALRGRIVVRAAGRRLARRGFRIAPSAHVTVRLRLGRAAARRGVRRATVLVRLAGARAPVARRVVLIR